MVKKLKKHTGLRLFLTITIITFLTLGVFIVVQASGTLQFSNHTPVHGSTLSVFNPDVSVYVKESTYNLVSSSLKVTLNGSPVSASLKYKGHYEYDTCGNPYWVVDSYKEGTVSFKTSGLAFGSYTVNVQIANSNGDTALEAWSFYVAGDIVFRYPSPSNGTAVGIRKPVVSLRAYAPNGSFTVDDIVMSVGSSNVIPTLSYQADHYLISWQSATDMPDAYYPVSVAVYNRGKDSYESTSWGFTVSTSFVGSNHTPAKGSTVDVTNPRVSVYMNASANKLNASSVTAKMNGTLMPAKLQYKGHWEYDSCGNPYYVVESYCEGTVYFDTSTLANGTYNVEISIANELGTVLTETWSFAVGTQIRFYGHTPSNNSITGIPQPRISILATDGVKDPNNVRMFINGLAVTPVVAEVETNVLEIAHTPVAKLEDGVNTVLVEVFDLDENMYKPAEWSFTVDSKPKASEWNPVKGSTVNTSQLTGSVWVRDSYNHLDSATVAVRVDGLAVPASFAYAEFYDYEWHYIDKTSGLLSFDMTGLADGQHTVEVRIADTAGNLMVETWSFTVMEAPKFLSLSPANQSENGTVDEISVVVTDTGAVDWNTVRMTVNGSAVAFTTVPESNLVKFPQSLSTGTYQIYVEARDMAGNLGTASWSFLVDKQPPNLLELYHFTDGMTITNGSMSFYAELQDTVDIKDNVALLLNGEPMDINWRYEGYSDSCTGIYIVTSKKKVYVNFEGIVPDGQHTLGLYTEDKLGNKVTRQWSFNVVTPPVISNETPLKYGVNEFMPEISAIVKDINGQIVADSVAMTVNGAAVPFNYDMVSGKVSFTPGTPLANEEYYSVYVSAVDNSGLSSTRSWKFYLSTYPDMADSSMDNCTLCHSYTPRTDSNGPFEDIHNGVSFGGSHSYNDCDDCHAYVSVPAGCDQCHGDEGQEVIYPHGSTLNIKYSATNYDKYFPLRVTQNREMWDCIICHQPGSQVKAYVGSYSTPTRVMDNHDIPELHKAQTDSCTECHARSLTREHAREGRFAVDGTPINCATCHRSSRSDIQAAISTGNTDCGACHAIDTTGPAHSTFHVVSYGTQCVNCHGNNMMSESVYHQNNCKGCHNSTNPKVMKAIELQNRTCFGCHEQPHGVKMSVVREDIPLYNGVIWSKPDSAKVWSAEGWLPQELNNEMAIVLISNRATLNRDTVKQYYETEMALAGWTPVESVTETADSFRLVYRKGRRLAYIWYNGDTSGARIRLAYN